MQCEKTKRAFLKTKKTKRTKVQPSETTHKLPKQKQSAKVQLV